MAGATKRQHGQYFTTTNPFNAPPFRNWLTGIPYYGSVPLLEPFAGANNIVVMLRELGYADDWVCYDIAPVNNAGNASGIIIQQRDTLNDYPPGYPIAITNPPYLAKNSATRRGLPFPITQHDDLYKVALDVMLANSEYVGAIIPESFITSGLFHDRLQVVISLTCPMFADTAVPVCLALFVPAHIKPRGSDTDFDIYSGDTRIGAYRALTASPGTPCGARLDWRFNDPAGEIGLYAIDGTAGPSIAFVPGDEIDPARVISTSRSVTRIRAPGLGLSGESALAVVARANELLTARRTRTGDVSMTAYQGLRRDGRYRRRLDFAQAREILDHAAGGEGIREHPRATHSPGMAVSGTSRDGALAARAAL